MRSFSIALNGSGFIETPLSLDEWEKMAQLYIKKWQMNQIY